MNLFVMLHYFDYAPHLSAPLERLLIVLHDDY